MRSASLGTKVLIAGALCALGLAAVIVAVGGWIDTSAIADRLAEFLTWVRGLGNWGAVILAIVYIPACLLFLPGSWITLGGGFAFGVVRGTIAVSIGSTLGASAAFWVGRTVARGRIESLVSKSPRFQALDEAVEQQGLWIVFLTRLSPVIPFNLLNYAFGLTRVRFRDYLLGSWIGMLPGTIMYVYLGSAAKGVADIISGKVEGGSSQRILFFVGLAATVVVTILVTRIARQALAKAAPRLDGKQSAVGQASSLSPDEKTS